MRARLLVLLPLVLAGCVAALEAPSAERESAPRAEALALRADGLMGAAPDAEDAVALRWGWRQWLDGVIPPEWASEPSSGARLVTSAIATVEYEANAPVTTLGTRPEWTVWFGVEESFVDHVFRPGPPALAPGQRDIVTFDVALPPGGLFVGPGERLVLRVGSYYDDDAARGAISVIVGGEGATRVDVVSVPLAPWGPPRVTVTEEATVTLTGGRCVGLDRATEDDLAWLDVVADPTQGRLIGIDVDVDHVEGRGPPDVDFFLLDAEGELVGYAGGSAGTERLRLREPNLAEAEPDAAWRLGVYACTPQRSTSHVVVAMHYA